MSHQPPARPLAFLFALSAIATAFYAVLWAIDMPGWTTLPPSLWTGPEAREALTQLAQVTVGLLGVAVTVVSIIVELASNRYTPRITEVFLRDTVNLAVLSFFVITAVLSLWVSLSVPDDHLPRVMVLTTVFAVSVSLLGLLPYFAYVFDFLSPVGLVGRLADEAVDELDAPDASARTRLLQRLDQLGDVALKSVQNQDKTIAIAACTALHDVATAHIAAKPGLPETWFEVDEVLRSDSDFVAFHAVVLDDARADRIWLEMKVLLQLHGTLRESLHDLRDLAHLVGILTRRLGVEAAVRGDLPALRICTRFLNTYLRSAIQAEDVRTVYNLLGEYRAFAGGLVGTPGQPAVLELAANIKSYGQLAFKARLAFILETAAYDLCDLIEEVHAAGAPEAEALLQIFLDVDREPDGGAVQEAGLRGVRKAQVKLATWYLQRGEPTWARRIHADMQAEDPRRLQSIRDELERTTERVWSEISDRGVNFDWLEPGRRSQLEVFFAWFS